MNTAILENQADSVQPQFATPNHLLAALRPDESDRLRPHFQPIHLWPGQVLYAPGLAVTHVHFPGSALASVICTTACGDSMEVATIGREGALGVTFAPRDTWTQGRVVVQAAGEAIRLPLAIAQREWSRGGNLLTLTLRHQELLKAQMAQTALCSHAHTVDQQVSRWILTQLDRSPGDRLVVTQQQVAGLLGVRRESVSGAVGRLQAEGVLFWGRGRLLVRDRAALQARCCECYGVLRAAARSVCGLTEMAA